MDYNINKLNIPNLYSNKNDTFISEINDIHEIMLKPYEKRKIYTDNYAYCITNNTEIYITGGDFATSNIHDKKELLNIYNKMYLFLFYGCYIENHSDEIAYLKIITYNNCNIMQLYQRYDFSNTLFFLMNRYGCRCNNQRSDFTFIENIVIKTKQKINVKYKYFDEKDILFCYKIKYIHKDLYELQIYKIINKKNDDRIIIPQKNKDNIIEYYNDIYNQCNNIFNHCEMPIVMRIEKKDLFNYYYMYYEVKKLDNHLSETMCFNY